MRASRTRKSKNPLLGFAEKWLAPIGIAILLGAATWVFFTRLDKLEAVTTDMKSTVDKMGVIVGELDKNTSKDAETYGTMQSDVSSLKSDVRVLEVEVDNLRHR